MSLRQKNSIGQNTPPTRRTRANVATKSRGMVSHYPLSSGLIVFGLGLSVGVAVASIIGRPVTARPSFGQRAELAAEGLGRQMRHALAGVLPESLSKHIAS